MSNIEQITLLDANKPDKVKDKLNEITGAISNIEMAIPTKEQIGLGEVDNTSDANKPISNAQQLYIDNLDANNLKKSSEETQVVDSDIALAEGKKLNITRSSGQEEQAVTIDYSEGQENILFGSKNVPTRLQHSASDIAGNNVGRNPKINIKEYNGTLTTENIAFVSDVEELESSLENDILEVDIKLNNLSGKVDGMNAMNRFLSTWNCEIGLPNTNPNVMPYTYQNGDYYIIGKVSETLNYKPANTPTYDGTVSTVVETETPLVNDVYVYDGTQFDLMPRSSIIMSNIKKADKVEDAVENNVAILDVEGNLKDSGIAKEDIQSAINHSNQTGNPHDTLFSELGGKPTTVEGYGITNAYNKTEVDSLLSGIDTKFDELADLLEGV